MNSSQLRTIQSPLKQRYREDPASAVVMLRAEGETGEGVTCSIDTGKALVKAGLHEATGGDGSMVCSGNMLLEALAACAGVTLNAVASAMEIDIGNARIVAEGELDFRGTLGVSKEAPVGFMNIHLTFIFNTDIPEDQIEKLIGRTERYCVVLQTLRNPPSVSVVHSS